MASQVLTVLEHLPDSRISEVSYCRIFRESQSSIPILLQRAIQQDQWLVQQEW